MQKDLSVQKSVLMYLPLLRIRAAIVSLTDELLGSVEQNSKTNSKIEGTSIFSDV